MYYTFINQTYRLGGMVVKHQIRFTCFCLGNKVHLQFVSSLTYVYVRIVHFSDLIYVSLTKSFTEQHCSIYAVVSNFSYDHMWTEGIEWTLLYSLKYPRFIERTFGFYSWGLLKENILCLETERVVHRFQILPALKAEVA